MSTKKSLTDDELEKLKSQIQRAMKKKLASHKKKILEQESRIQELESRLKMIDKMAYNLRIVMRELSMTPRNPGHAE